MNPINLPAIQARDTQHSARVHPLDKMPSARDRRALLAVVNQLGEALREIDQTLRVPAAEYVPAIGDAFIIIDRALALLGAETTP